jgi:hypothetical protein
MDARLLAIMILLPFALLFVYSGIHEYQRYKSEGRAKYGLVYDDESGTTHVTAIAGPACLALFSSIACVAEQDHVRRWPGRWIIGMYLFFQSGSRPKPTIISEGRAACCRRSSEARR